MTSVIVDSDVLIDVITDDPRWGEWSSQALAQAADESMLVINALIYAEVSIGFGAHSDGALDTFSHATISDERQRSWPPMPTIVPSGATAKSVIPGESGSSAHVTPSVERQLEGVTS